MANAMHYLMVGIFEHLKITAKTDVDQRSKYKECILKGPALTKYQVIFLVCKETVKTYAKYQWTLREAKDSSVGNF